VVALCQADFLIIILYLTQKSTKMRYAPVILFLIIAASCRNNPKLKFIPSENYSESSNTDTNRVQINFHRSDTISFAGYLQDPNTDPLVISFCRGKFNLSDNANTLKLLDRLTQKNDKYFPFYFYVFNKICENSGGALGELMGEYCFRFCVNYPKEILKHFESSKLDLYLYSKNLGAEFYFKSEGTSNLKMNFAEFKKYLYGELDSNNNELSNIATIFFTKIDSTMGTMNSPLEQLELQQ
jgi:hypothetical protein